MSVKVAAPATPSATIRFAMTSIMRDDLDSRLTPR